MAKYPFETIEPKWQKYWADQQTFKAKEDTAFPKEKRRYVLDMFPYPSAQGLHVGHPEGYTATDIYCRYLRMNGYNVLHTMGFDAFGLPAENYAIKTGTHPTVTTAANIERFRSQIKALGFSYDWDREVDTSDVHYYRWTQWIFLKLFEKGLAYEAESPINFCPSCKTGLANEEVKDGLCERCGATVTRKRIRQWILKITAYAERLLADLDGLDWPEPVKLMQRNWIGRSEGANVVFKVDGHPDSLEVYTTRPDTLFGATYMVLSPEHPLVEKITTPGQKQTVSQYLEAAALKSDLERTYLAKEKTGVFSGAYAINPVNDEKIPIWIADYVLISYGTGAIMAVPAHDERDWDFAKTFGLPIILVVSAEKPESGKDYSAEPAECTAADGYSVNSGAFTGLPTAEAKKRITDWLEEKGIGKKAVNYKLRDWIFSRQRYWGEPIPVVHCAQCGIVPLPESALPLKLPEVTSYAPTGTGESPLAGISEWVNTTCPKCGGPAKRETNTMPQWAGSCWYYLRYLDPHNANAFAAQDKINYWLPVDLYVGGAEHAVLHLLYSRFWHKVLYDFGLVNSIEPFQRLINQGMILGEDNQKMSKSRGNVINPDDIITNYGADAMRVYEMFMGPLEVSKPWITAGLIGVSRFLERLWMIGNRDWGSGTGDQGVEEEKQYGEIIQRSNSLARGDESCRNDISANEKFPQRGNVRTDQPNQEIICVNSCQHSGRQWSEKQEGVSALSVNCERFNVGTGNPFATSGTSQLSVNRDSETTAKPTANDRTFTERSQEISNSQSLIPDPQPRPKVEGSPLDPRSPIPDPRSLESLTKLLHRTIKKVTADTESINFNTAISAMMIYSNELVKFNEIPRALWEPLVIMLSAYAPHLGEELWEKLGHVQSVNACSWPGFDEALTHDDEVTVVVQVNGKIRDKFTAAVGTATAELEKTALALPGVLKWTEGHTVAKVISVPDKLVNIVVK